MDGETRIKSRFGAALRCAERMHGRDFQAQISRATQIESSNLSQIVKRDKGATEEVRRKIYGECARLVPQFEGVGYDGFLTFGGLILSGMPEKEALERVISGGYTLPAPQIAAHANVVQNGVNNGVMSVVGDNRTLQQDEFRAEIEGWTTECFSKLSLSAKCTVRDAMLKSVPGFAEYVAQKEQQE